VIGVDTHRDEHVVAVLTAAAGAVVAGKAIGANGRGYRETLRFGECHAAGRRAWAIEGTGSYGAGLARYLAEHRDTVLKVSRTLQAERRLRGKDDSLDAVRTARAALASDTLALPRALVPRGTHLSSLEMRRRCATFARHSMAVRSGLRGAPSRPKRTTNVAVPSREEQAHISVGEHIPGSSSGSGGNTLLWDVPKARTHALLVESC